MDTITVNNPFELSLYLKGDRRVKNVEILEAPNDDFYAVCIELEFWTKALCLFWSGYKTALNDSFAKRVTDISPVGIKWIVKLIL